VLADGNLRQRGAGKHIEAPHIGIADGKAARRPGRRGDFERQRGRAAIGQEDGGELLHGCLEGQGAANGVERCPLSFVICPLSLVQHIWCVCGGNGQRTKDKGLVEPAQDRVAGEVDHAAAGAVDCGDQLGVDLIELAGQLLGAASRPEGAGQRLGERGEAGDVGEQRDTRGMFGEIETTRQRQSAILREIGGKRSIHRALLGVGLVAQGCWPPLRRAAGWCNSRMTPHEDD
jgi:hypothetical protein